MGSESLADLEEVKKTRESINTKQEKNNELNLAGKGIKNLDFLTKFIRENPYISKVDLSLNNVNNNEANKLA